MQVEKYFAPIWLTIVLLIFAGCVPSAGDAIPTPVPSPTIPTQQPVPSPTMPPARATDTRAPLATPTQPRAPIANTPTRPSGTPPFLPAPGDGMMDRGNAFIDSAELRILESFPPQVLLTLQGSLPTPCHQIRVRPSPPDRENKIQVEVYSVSSPGAICIQVLAPFDANVPLGSFPKGKYTVWVNGEQVGTFDAP